MPIKSRKKPPRSQPIGTKILVALAIFVAMGSGWFWYGYVYSTPEKVFRTMLENNLRTTGFTRTISQSFGQSQQEQVVEVTFGPRAIVHGTTALTQQTASGKNTVKNETIGTKEADFLRYTQITADPKNTAVQNANFSKIINVWSREEKTPANPLSGQRFLQEGLLGIIPFGNLATADRQKITQSLINSGAYTIDYVAAARRQVNGQAAYVYDVKLNPAKYSSVLKDYLKALHLGNVSGLEIINYDVLPDINLKMTVAVLSRQLVSVDYGGQRRNETYSGYGVVSRPQTPKQTISLDDLQSRLRNLTR